jgi:hypothetical protein
MAPAMQIQPAGKESPADRLVGSKRWKAKSLRIDWLKS